MKNGSLFIDRESGAYRFKTRKAKVVYYLFYAVLLLLYIVACVYVNRLSRSQRMLQIGQARLPATAFTGIMSAITSMGLVFLVVFYKRLGVYTALIAQITQLPVLFYNILGRHNLSVLPGVFINLFMIAVVILLYTQNKKIEDYRNEEMNRLIERQRYSHNMFEQTAEALVNAIDAKDAYTTGHSQRVAEYSRMIAEEAGENEEFCGQVYSAALLHDVGKIGIPLSILNKPGRLTVEEFNQIKSHPVMGGQILSSIHESPYLSTAARHHHERYDGKGYPDGLKGASIPEIARIIAVADAYDAMTSDRSYRAAMSQDRVREELVKGVGTQFDPRFAQAMIRLVDRDTGYKLQEEPPADSPVPDGGVHCETLYHDCTAGVRVSSQKARLTLYARPEAGCPAGEGLPTLILFDALDGKVHPGQEGNKDILYYEYARIHMDGRVEADGARAVRTTDAASAIALDPDAAPGDGRRWDIEAMRYRDHALIRVSDGALTREVVLALPDSSRLTYLAVTGERCDINGLSVKRDESEIAPDAIPRVAGEVSFIDGRPSGNLPNVQVDGPQSSASEGISLRKGVTLGFHTRSLPTARLVWHCPYICVYSSSDNRVGGSDYREYILLRLDGENSDSNRYADNEVTVRHTPAFKNWNDWKERNREGYDCTVAVQRQDNRITIQTENLGIGIRSVTTLRDSTRDVYVALTGDQCAITSIRVSR